MTHKHTPGPWGISHTDGSKISITLVGRDDDPFICSLFTRDPDDRHSTHPVDEDWANAQLITAAPDMLAALEEVTRNVSWDDEKDRANYQMDGKTMKMVRDAIHKATGKDTQP